MFSQKPATGREDLRVLVDQRRDAIKAAVARHRGRRVRIFGSVVRGAEGVRLPATAAPIRAGRHYMDVARGYMMHDDRDRCLDALLAAEEHAPQQARNHPAVREMVGTLARLDRARKRSLLGFARRVGL